MARCFGRSDTFSSATDDRQPSTIAQDRISQCLQQQMDLLPREALLASYRLGQSSD